MYNIIWLSRLGFKTQILHLPLSGNKSHQRNPDVNHQVLLCQKFLWIIGPKN